MIVMVMEDITRNANAIVRAAANYLRENGYLSIFCETGAKAAYFDEYLTALIERGVVDGCIVITSRPHRAGADRREAPAAPAGGGALVRSMVEGRFGHSGQLPRLDLRGQFSGRYGAQVHRAGQRASGGVRLL